MLLIEIPRNGPTSCSLTPLITAGLQRNISWFVLVWSTIWLLNSCSMVQSSMWTSFVDDLGTGSKIEPESTLINADGELNVRITKAASPEWSPDKKLDYPYAGVMMFLSGWGKPLDISEAEGLLIEYQLNGSMSLKLKQEGISAGKEYMVELAPSDKVATRYIPWSDFAQPKWVQEPVALNLEEMIGLMFVNNSGKLSTAVLTIRNISFPNWENPDSVIVKMKSLGRSLGVTETGD